MNKCDLCKKDTKITKYKFGYKSKLKRFWIWIKLKLFGIEVNNEYYEYVCGDCLKTKKIK